MEDFLAGAAGLCLVVIALLLGIACVELLKGSELDNKRVVLENAMRQQCLATGDLRYCNPVGVNVNGATK